MCKINSFSLYLHIPYCASKCPYCAFNSYSTGGVPPEYVATLTEEITRSVSLLRLGNREVDTIYFGGGTPSLLDAETAGRILSSLEKTFAFTPSPEITFEINPASGDGAYLKALRQAGFNRLSIGIQSFDDRFLQLLGRIHDAQEAQETIKVSRAAGFDNLSLDLICGMPGQTMKDIISDLRLALSFAPEHLSLYLLALEEGTPFRERYKGLLEDEERDDRGRSMCLAAAEWLEGRGYERYETSNFARPGYRSRHNMKYWNGEDYLGLGAGAHSYLSAVGWGARWWNLLDPDAYTKEIAKGKLPLADLELLDRNQAIQEALMTGLRRKEGVETGEMEAKFGLSLREIISPEVLRQIPAQLYSFEESKRFRLTTEGFIMADEIAARLAK